MTPFLFLAAMVFILVACLLNMALLHTPKAQLKLGVRTLPEGSCSTATCKRLAKLLAKKQKKRRLRVKLGCHITFKPKFKNKQWKTEPNLIFIGHTLQSSTAVFFSDPYHIFQSKTDGQFATPKRLFDINLPDQGKKFAAPAMHCNGLFALTTANNNVLVCNPTTKEVITLPRSSNVHILRPELKENNGHNLRLGFGFLQSTQSYKVVRYFYWSYNFKECSYVLGVEVFTVGQSTCWRTLARQPPRPIRSTCSTFTGNCIYFYIWCAFDGEPNAFLCFHLRNERYSTLYPPDPLKHISVTTMMLTNMKGRLCLSALSHNNTKFCVFATKIGMNLLGWTPMFSFNIALPPRDVLVIPIVEYRGKLLVHVNDKKSPQRLEFYNLKDGTVQQAIGELKDSRLEREGFRIFADKPWFYVSTYEEKAYLNLSEFRIRSTKYTILWTLFY